MGAQAEPRVRMAEWIAFAFAALFACGAVARRNPADVAFSSVARALGHDRRLGPTPAPRRFSSAMASTFFAALGVLIVAQAPEALIVGYALLLALPPTVIVLTNWCLGAWLYRMLFGSRPARAT